MFAARSEFGADAASAGGLMASLVGTGRSSADRLQSPMVGALGAARMRVQPISRRGAEMACISVMSSLDAATAQGSVALSLLGEEAVACISSDERIRFIGRHPLRQLVLSRLRPAGGRFAELHLPGHCGQIGDLP
jgi:hypothetical protein